MKDSNFRKLQRAYSLILQDSNGHQSIISQEWHSQDVQLDGMIWRHGADIYQLGFTVPVRWYYSPATFWDPEEGELEIEDGVKFDYITKVDQNGEMIQQCDDEDLLSLGFRPEDCDDFYAKVFDQIPAPYGNAPSLEDQRRCEMEDYLWRRDHRRHSPRRLFTESSDRIKINQIFPIFARFNGKIVLVELYVKGEIFPGQHPIYERHLQNLVLDSWEILSIQFVRPKRNIDVNEINLTEASLDDFYKGKRYDNFEHPELLADLKKSLLLSGFDPDNDEQILDQIYDLATTTPW